MRTYIWHKRVKIGVCDKKLKANNNNGYWKRAGVTQSLGMNTLGGKDICSLIILYIVQILSYFLQAARGGRSQMSET